MGRRFPRLSRSLALCAVAAALAFGLVSPPAAVADDRLQFTGTTLSGTPFSGASLRWQACRAVVLDAVVPLLQR